MEVKGYLYPKPALNGVSLTNVWGDRFKMKNRPFLELEFFKLPRGKYEVEILYPIHLKKKFETASSYTSLSIFSESFGDPKLSETEMRISGKRIKKKFTLPLMVHKISGKVKDFCGNPFPCYLWATREHDEKFKSIVKADDNGRFVFYYPEGKELRLFVDDESYSTKTLECWIMANTLKSDVNLNPKVGDFELYDLRVWFTTGLCYFFFVPASLPLILKEKKSGWKKRFPPVLTDKDTEIRINNRKVDIKEFVEIPTSYGKNYYPSYIGTAEFEFEGKSPVIVNVKVDCAERGRGEAWYIHYF